LKTRALTAPNGRGSFYLDESEGVKWSRDLQERFSADVFTYTVTHKTQISDTTHICAPDKDAD
jgi:hypothetical protein